MRPGCLNSSGAIEPSKMEQPDGNCASIELVTGKTRLATCGGSTALNSGVIAGLMNFDP
jgi:hypothetical protein